MATAAGTPPPISASELRGIEARGWQFGKLPNGAWVGTNERLKLKTTDDAATVEEAVERALNLEWAAENGHVNTPTILDREIIADAVKSKPSALAQIEPRGAAPVFGADEVRAALVAYVRQHKPKRERLTARFSEAAINAAAGDGAIIFDDGARRFFVAEASKVQRPVDYDLVPGDPHKRTWSSLSDIEQARWGKRLTGATGEDAERMKRLKASMDLRDQIKELHEGISKLRDNALVEAAQLYAGEPRLLEIVEAERARRAAPPQTPQIAASGPPDSTANPADKPGAGKKKRLTIHDLAKQLELLGLSRGDLRVLGYRDSTIDSAVIHGSIRLSEKGIVRSGDKFVHVDTAPVAAVAGPETVTALSTIAQTAVEQLSLFDYAHLDEADAIIVRRCTAEIRERVVSIRRNTVEIGERLREVKSRLERGAFDDWLNQEIGLSRDTADRLIQVAEYVLETPQRAEIAERFDRTALYLLVAPSTPESARVELAARAAAGEPITKAKAAAVVKAHKPAAVGGGRRSVVGSRPALATAVAGACRCCGCTHFSPCLEEVGDEESPCAWVEGENSTLCTSCRGLMESRGLDEATLRARLQSDSSEASPSRVVAAAEAVAVADDDSLDTGSASSNASSEAESVKRDQAETAAWNQALIKIDILLFKHDGDKAGRRVQVAVSANEDAPTFIHGRESDVFNTFPAGDDDERLALPLRTVLRLYDLPSTVAQMLFKLATELPGKLAGAEKKAPAAKPATARKPAKKAAPKKTAPAKKPAAPSKRR